MNYHLRSFGLVYQSKISSAFAFMVPRWRTCRQNIGTANLRRFISRTADESHLEERLERSNRSVFCGGLKPGTTEEMISEYFSKFGDVEDVRMVKTFLGISRNYGFVCFKSPSVVGNVLRKKHELQGKVIDVNRCKQNRVVYVGGLPSHMTESTLQKYFSKFGRVESVRFIDNSKLDYKSSYAFITFSSIEEASKAILEEKQTIEDCIVKVQLRESGDHVVEAQATKSKKVKVECLPFRTITVEKLQDYFETFGHLKSIDLLLNSQTRACAAIVVFHEVDSVEKLLAKRNHAIDGCAVNLVRIPNNFKTNAREKSLYLENLAPQTTGKSVIKYFSPYGYVAKALVVKDPVTGVSQGSGVVKFRNIKDSFPFVGISKHFIDGSLVTARRRGIKFRSKFFLDEISGYNLHLSDSHS